MADQLGICADARHLTAAFAARRVRPTQALAACLARIEQGDAQLGVCNHQLDPAALLEVAKAADKRWREGVPLSPLDGVPFGVKANIAVVGQPWHGGIEAFRERRADEDSACVARLRAAGMIPVAVFNMHEGALGETSDNPAFQTTRNPHNPAHIPGGSSGGSAAAVAAGMVHIALGTDSLGSVRLPSALCGVVGFKPAHGEISTDGVMPLSPRLDHVGIHARSVADIAQVWALLASDRAERNPASLAEEVLGAGGGPPKADGGSGEVAAHGEHVERPLDGFAEIAGHPGDAWRWMHWRLGPRLRFDAPIADGFSQLLRQWAVTEVLDWSDADLSALRRAGLLTCERDAALCYAAALRERPDSFSETFRSLLAWGAEQPQEKVRQAESRLAQARLRLHHELAGAMLLSPTTAHLAPQCGTNPPTTLADLTAPAAIAGIPSISLPLGKALGGLPMGLQISGLDSAAVLGAAAKCLPGVAAVAN